VLYELLIGKHKLPRKIDDVSVEVEYCVELVRMMWFKIVACGCNRRPKWQVQIAAIVVSRVTAVVWELNRKSLLAGEYFVSARFRPDINVYGDR
jgi:hypothetical protein